MGWAFLLGESAVCLAPGLDVSPQASAVGFLAAGWRQEASPALEGSRGGFGMMPLGLGCDPVFVLQKCSFPSVLGGIYGSRGASPALDTDFCRPQEHLGRRNLPLGPAQCCRREDTSGIPRGSGSPILTLIPGFGFRGWNWAQLPAE